MQLTKAEEEVMKYIWELGTCYMKDLVEQFPEPKPAYTTVATLVSRLVDKKAIGYHQRGSVREYYAELTKADYFGSQVKGMIKGFFNGNALQFASFFANKTELTQEQLKELREHIDKQLLNTEEDGK